MITDKSYHEAAAAAVNLCMNGAPYYVFRNFTPTEIRAVADRIRQVANYFEQNPHMRAKGRALTDKGTVCAIGAVKYSRKIGLRFAPDASRNCNSRDVVDTMFDTGIVMVNDSAMPAEQFRNYMHNVANVLEKWSYEKDRTTATLATAFRDDQYFKRIAKQYGADQQYLLGVSYLL